MAIDDSQQKVAQGVTIAFPILGAIAVVLRLWSRRLTNSTLLIEDWLILGAYVLAVAQTVTSWYYIKTNFVGIHIWDIPPDYDQRIGQVWNYANQLLYNPILSLVKISVLIFLLRLDSRSRVIRHLNRGTIWFTLTLMIATLITDLFQCHPVPFVYDKTIPGGTCINQGAFYVATAVLTIFTDLLVMSIPVIITYSLQMALRKKIAVSCILSLGGVATAIGCWRLAQLVQAFFPSSVNPDPTYSIGFCSSAIEVNTAIIAACAPSLKAIASRYLPRLWATSRGGRYGYGGKPGSGTPGTNHRYRASGLGYSRNVVSNPAHDDAFEMGRQYHSHISGPGQGPNRTTSGTPSLSDEEGVSHVMGGTGIVKTTNVFVREDRHHGKDTRAGSSVDSLV